MGRNNLFSKCTTECTSSVLKALMVTYLSHWRTAGFLCAKCCWILIAPHNAVCALAGNSHGIVFLTNVFLTYVVLYFIQLSQIYLLSNKIALFVILSLFIIYNIFTSIHHITSNLFFDKFNQYGMYVNSTIQHV